MFALFLIVHIFIGSTLAGSAVIAGLTLGYTDGRSLITAAAIGFLASFPVSWSVAKRLFSKQA